MIMNSLIKAEYATMSQLDMTLCFQNTFKCKISQPTLGGNKSNKSEEYRDLYGLIFEKKKNLLIALFNKSNKSDKYSSSHFCIIKKIFIHF